ncbi:uncharacterized protein LOC116801302 [Drosophila sechellia]|uniref:uncharacterized protein LOC116801302 n=1 Tax=Drosophila sechellia TaxID=7238 RepID=UPI0013DDAEF0|nr:uncharacterized protein LOC116801302 [Drosophila sechellia]
MRRGAAILELGKMQHSPRKSARLNGGEATPVTTVSQQPASSGAGTRTRVNITAASIPCPATTVTTVASQPRSTAVTAASSVPEVNQPLVLELMERIAALERELEKARSLESVSTANCAPIAVGPSAVGSAWLQEYANVVCTVLDVEGKEPRRRLLHASVDHNECDQQDDRHGGCPICGG